MQADVILNGDKLELHGSVVATDNEITSQGPTAGYSFHDRSDPTNRYVLYADKGKLFIWQDEVGNILTIDEEKIIVKSRVKMSGEIPIYTNTQVDYLETIQDLQAQVKDLRARVLKLQGLPAEPGERPGPPGGK